jgi:predicted acetyltransferase
MDIEIQQAFLEDKTILRNLLELGTSSLYHKSGGRLAGLALVRELDGSGTDRTHSIAEFFILRKYRHQRIGQTAAQRIFDMFPGRWRVAQTENNHPAQAFWRMVISRYTQGNFQEIWSNDEEWKGPIQTFGTGTMSTER